MNKGIEGAYIANSRSFGGRNGPLSSSCNNKLMQLSLQNFLQLSVLYFSKDTGVLRGIKALKVLSKILTNTNLSADLTNFLAYIRNAQSNIGGDKAPSHIISALFCILSTVVLQILWGPPPPPQQWT